MHLFGPLTAIMITTSNSSVKRSGTPNQFLGVLLHTMAISGLSRVRTELAPLLIVPSLAHHPVQTNRQSAGHGYLGGFASPSHHQVKVFAAPLWQAAHRHLRRFYQKKAQHGTALLGDVSQSGAIPAGVFQRHQSEIARHLLGALKAVGFSDDQHEGQCSERTDTRMRHQPLRCGTLLDLLLDSPGSVPRIERGSWLAWRNRFETSYLADLQKGDEEAYNSLKAQQDVETANATVTLQTLQTDEDKQAVILAQDRQFQLIR
jgi:hypothetical protein